MNYVGDALRDALRAGQARPVMEIRAARRVIVAGAGGALGSAVVEQLLGSGAFARVDVIVTQPLGSALRGLTPVLFDSLAETDQTTSRTIAVVVFDRARHANGREQAFLKPEPSNLPALAQALRDAGVRQLIVVMPHTAGSLPQALKLGLAGLDEQAVAQIGFDSLLFVRSSQYDSRKSAGTFLHRLALWVLAQLQMMIAQRDRPVRSSKLAQLIAELARQLPFAPHGTRVIPPEVVWEASQTLDIAALADDVLHGRERAPSDVPHMRM